MKELGLQERVFREAECSHKYLVGYLNEVPTLSFRLCPPSVKQSTYVMRQVELFQEREILSSHRVQLIHRSMICCTLWKWKPWIIFLSTSLKSEVLIP